MKRNVTVQPTCSWAPILALKTLEPVPCPTAARDPRAGPHPACEQGLHRGGGP